MLLLCLNLLSAQKIALLIGNSEYKHIDVLTSPSKDIPALAEKLRGLGFEVMEKYDLDRRSMKKTMKAFKKKLLKHRGAIGLFYYSGHGAQAYGESYLIPVDVDTRNESDVEIDAIKIENIAKRMASANTKANILFLDACRNVPTGTMGGVKGLGQVKNRPSGSLIVYSTSKNAVARDNQLFNKVVLAKIGQNIPLTTLANDISYTVDQKTNGEQVPEVFVKSLPEVCLGGSCVDSSEPKVKIVEKIVYRERPQEVATAAKKPKFSKDIVKIGNLMYQNQPFTKEYTWKKAKGYCKDLTLGGYNDWRLPTRSELNNISNIKMYGKYDSYSNWEKWFDKNKHRRLKNSKGKYHFVDKRFIENMPEDSWFWTSESKDSSYAWYIKSNDNYALCVR